MILRSVKLDRLLGPVVFRIALCISCSLQATAWADLTIEGTHSPGMYGGVEREVVYLSDNQMRIDRLSAPMTDNGPGNGQDNKSDGRLEDGVAGSVLVRFSGSPSGMLYLDHESKSVQILSSLREFGANQSATSISDPSASEVRIVKQAETREMLGHTAHRYDFSFTGSIDPLVLLGQQLPTGLAAFVRIDLQVTGTSWVVPGMAGANELVDFFELLSKRQLTIHPLGQAGSATAQELSILSPGLARAFTEVFTQITRAGFPLKIQSHSQMNIYPQGSVAVLIQGMLETLGIASQQNTESVVTVVGTGKVPPELFYGGKLPPGYSLNTSP